MPGLARITILIVTFFTGAAGLIYEVTWHRYLANLIGGEARAAAIIIALFLGGLALGYRLFGILSRQCSPRALGWYCAGVELGIGIWAIFFPVIYQWLWQQYGIAAVDNWALLYDCAVCALMLLFPTILMGGTLPLLTQALARDLDDSAGIHARIYAVNTLGACFGCLAAGFILIPQLGLPVTLLFTSGINIIAAVVIFLVSSRLPANITGGETASEGANMPHSGTAPILLWRVCTIAIISGFYSITVQTLCMRVVGLGVGASEYAFSMTVAVFVLLLSVGAYTLPKDPRKFVPLWLNQLLAALGLLLFYVLVPSLPHAAHVLRTLLTSAPPNFMVYYAAIFIALLVLFFTALFPMGRTLPLLFSESRERMGNLGDRVGLVYGLNTAGCVLGALVGGYLVFYLFDLDLVLKLCTILVALSALLALPPRKRITGVLGVLVIVGAIIVSQRWDPRILSCGAFRTRGQLPYSYESSTNFYRSYVSGHRVVTYKDDPNTSVAVTETALNPHTMAAPGQSVSRSIVVNGKSDGSTAGADLRTTRLLAHLPLLLLGGENLRVAVVGFGTGITVGTAAAHPEVAHVDVIEISPYVLQFAPLFDFANHRAIHHPKVHVRRADAYRILGASSTAYDLVISEPSNPWVVGVDRLY